MQAIWKKKEKLSPLGNEASLNFVSLRSHFNSVGRRGLSRVEMNALRAPLTTLYVSAEMEIFFSLDTADAFIEASTDLDSGGSNRTWSQLYWTFTADETGLLRRGRYHLKFLVSLRGQREFLLPQRRI
jgi:hypothetical protein